MNEPSMDQRPAGPHMCNLYSGTKGQTAIRALFRIAHDRTGNLPAFPGIFPDQMAPIVPNSADGERELVMARSVHSGGAVRPIGRPLPARRQLHHSPQLLAKDPPLIGRGARRRGAQI